MHRDRPLFVLCAAVGLAGMAENATWGNGERRAIWHRPLARCLWAVVYPANRRPVCLSDELPARPGERHTHWLHAIWHPKNLPLRHSRQCHKVEESPDRKRPRQPFCSQTPWAKRPHSCLMAEEKGVEKMKWRDWAVKLKLIIANLSLIYVCVVSISLNTLFKYSCETIRKCKHYGVNNLSYKDGTWH